jgi:hypothetical protein
MMEAVRTSETSVYLNETTRHYIQQGCNLQILTNTSSLSETLCSGFCVSAVYYDTQVHQLITE